MLKKVVFAVTCVAILLSLFFINDVRYLKEIGTLKENYYGKYSSQCSFYRSGFCFIKTGESVITTLSVEEIIEKFDANVISVKNDGEFISVYAYSEKLPRKVRINEGVVNLHVVVSKFETVVGSPLIFGSV